MDTTSSYDVFHLIASRAEELWHTSDPVFLLLSIMYHTLSLLAYHIRGMVEARHHQHYQSYIAYH